MKKFCRQSKNGRGFTLVELLVVIAIIGILVALLLPAVQSAREAARRTQCSNNLKQVALALHNYHTAVKSFPPGKITQGPCCNTKSGANWAIMILPYVEQQGLYDMYDMEKVNEDVSPNWAPAANVPPNSNNGVGQHAVPTYVCTSEPDTDMLDIPESGPGGGWGDNLKWRRSSYRCVGGRSDGSGWWDSGESNIAKHWNWRGALHVIGYGGIERPESFSSIRDGTSNTLLIGEMGTRTHPNRRTFWAYSYTSYNSSDITPQARTLLGDYDRCAQIGGPGGENACKRGWGSFHPGGLHFAFCDASVRFISDTVDMELLAAMATIDGREIISSP
ncbi:MAG: DUF1559 domain-containing protein [Planctomycetales bacterium]|nr:DUF1559 domain-containing protein [Planctomycetales bacterium]